MKLNDKQRVFAAAAVFVLIGGGLSVLNFLKFKQRGRLLAGIEQQRREEQLAQEKIRKIPELVVDRAELIANIDRYAEILPLEEHVQHDAFVEIMDNYRKDTRILIQKAEYIRGKEDGTAKAKESFIRHRYRFKLLGTVPDFIDFVNKVENHTRFLKVDAIRIKPYGSQDGFGDDLSDREDETELNRAANPVKDIELTVSTYTYFKGAQRKKPS
jgi:hypothetical protein